MQRRRPSLVRALSGVGLVIIGLVLLIVIFNTKGLLTPFDNKLIFSAGIASIATMTGFDVGLLSGYPLKMVLEPLVLALYTSYFSSYLFSSCLYPKIFWPWCSDSRHLYLYSCGSLTQNSRQCSKKLPEKKSSPSR